MDQLKVGLKSVAKFALAPSLVLAMTATSANAAYVVNIVEVGGNIVATGSGSLNVSSLRPTGDPFFGYNTYYPAMNPGIGVLILGPLGRVQNWVGIPYPNFFGTYYSSSAPEPTTSSGAHVGISYVNLGSATPSILTPTDYVSGADLGISTFTFANSNFAFYGLNPGTYVLNWGSGVNADSFTINVGTGSGAVPEPATWATMLAGFALMGFAMRRKSESTARVRLGYS